MERAERRPWFRNRLPRKSTTWRRLWSCRQNWSSSEMSLPTLSLKMNALILLHRNWKRWVKVRSAHHSLYCGYVFLFCVTKIRNILELISICLILVAAKLGCLSGTSAVLHPAEAVIQQYSKYNFLVPSTEPACCGHNGSDPVKFTLSKYLLVLQ